MRDLILSLIIIGLMPVSFRRPYIGLVMFSWLAYMRVQDLTWSFARGVRWSFYLAMLMFGGWAFSKRRGPFYSRDIRNYLMIAMIFLVGLGVMFARRKPMFGLTAQIKEYIEFVKIIAIALFTTGVVTSRERLRLLVWVIALSFGFYGFKNALWGLKTLGQVPIRTGPGGMLADNNDFALALGMAVPMLWMIGQSERREVLRRAFLVLVPMTAFTVLLTHSRGGFLAMCGGLGVLVWRSKHRAAGIVLATIGGLLGLLMMPEGMRERFSSIANYQEDSSANARFRSWAVAIRMAVDNPLVGVGLSNFRPNYIDYEPNPSEAQLGGHGVFVAHNSYLQIWAECGTPALLIYLLLMLLSLRTCWVVRSRARRRYYTSWMTNYATMFEASLVCFAIGAVFLNRAHFDLFYHWVAIIALFEKMALKELENPAAYPLRDDVVAPLRATRQRGFAPATKQRGFRDVTGGAQPLGGV
jgi:probable O-glycosylation ligase (exosortase A-associated)